MKKINLQTNENSKNIKLLFYALIIGFIVGIIGTVFRILLNYIENFVKTLYHNAGNYGFLSWVWPILFAIIGISFSLYLIRKFAPETAGSGIQEIEGALDEKRPMRWKRVLPIKFIASLFSLGVGMLLGREGPTIQIGANIGKMIKDIFGLPNEENNPLVSTGAAAGLATAFNAPFAGILFVIEEMHDHFKFNFFSVAAIIVGAATSDFTLRFFISPEPLIKMTVYNNPETFNHWMFIIIGAIFGVLGYAFNKILVKALDFFHFFSKIHVVISGTIIGLIIALTGIFFPEMIGGGYDTIVEIINHQFTIAFLVVLFIVRFILTVFSYSSGVSGGIFIPLVTLGLIVGMVFGNIIHNYFPELIASPEIFAVAGIAGMFASTIRAPLTGIALAAGMTSNYELILHLIITAGTASIITTLLGNQPIYSTLLKRTLKEKF